MRNHKKIKIQRYQDTKIPKSKNKIVADTKILRYKIPFFIILSAIIVDRYQDTKIQDTKP